jgi:hypothetical protein
MIRLCTFVLAGPVIGLLVLVAQAGGLRNHALEAFAIVVPFALVAGAIPASVTALLDGLMERRGVRSLTRYLATAACGYVAAYLLSVENMFEVEPLVPVGPEWGLIGAVPAAICSWITDVIGKSRIAQ